MKKRFIISALALSLILCSCAEGESGAESVSEAAPVTTAAVTDTKADAPDYSQLYRMRKKSDSVIIRNYIGTEKTVTVPSEIDGLPVTEISPSAFSGTEVQEIIFSEGITEIGGMKGAEKLRRIVIPSTVSKIDISKFEGLPALTDIEVTDNSSFAVRDGMLYTADMKTLLYGFNCGDKAVIPEGTEHIGKYAFCGSNIKSVQFPCTLKTIGSSAFQDCQKLLYADIPFNVTEIESYSFSGSGLMSVELHNGLERIGGYAFLGTSLEEITLPATVKDIEYNIVSDGCAVYAYYPDPDLDVYSPVYLAETRIQKAARLLPPMSNYQKGRIFLDMNYDGIPEYIECGAVYTGLLYFGKDEQWNNNYEYYLGGKLYHYYDRENNCDFYVAASYEDISYYTNIVRLSPLKDGIASNYIGYFDNLGQLVSGTLNGKWYMEYTDSYDIDTDKYILDAMQEYELLDVIDIDAIAEEHSEEWKFNVYLNEGSNAPDYNIPTREEYRSRSYIDIDGKEYYKDINDFSTDNEETLSELSRFDNLIELSLYGEWESVQNITKCKNIKALYINNNIKDLSALAEMDGIERLTIYNTDSYDFLAEMYGVRALRLVNAADKPDDFFKVIKDMKSLEYLLVDNYCDTDITEGQLKWLEENMPDVKVVYMW